MSMSLTLCLFIHCFIFTRPVDDLPKLSRSFKYRHITCIHYYFFIRFWIPRQSRLSQVDFKRTEAANIDTATRLHDVDNGRYESINNGFRFDLRQTRTCGNMVDNICFCHDNCAYDGG